MVGNLPAATTGRTRLTELFRFQAEYEFGMVEGLNRPALRKMAAALRNRLLLRFLRTILSR
jgi:hypothetical protein